MTWPGAKSYALGYSPAGATLLHVPGCRSVRLFGHRLAVPRGARLACLGALSFLAISVCMAASAAARTSFSAPGFESGPVMTGWWPALVRRTGRLTDRLRRYASDCAGLWSARSARRRRMDGRYPRG